MIMADKKNMTTQREKDIASQIRGACVAIVPDLETVNDHRDKIDDIQGEKGTLNISKLQIMSSIASMSSAGAWLPGEIKNAVAYASTTLSNADPNDRAAKSLATFLSEMKSVADPKVRDQFPRLLKVVEDAWEVEEQDKKAELPTPIRKWASRKYHAMVNVTRAVKDGKAIIVDVDDLVQYARENDPDHNHERVAKRLETLAKTLQGIFVDFANDDIGHAHKYISAITADDLLASRNVKLSKEREAARAAQAAAAAKAAAEAEKLAAKRAALAAATAAQEPAPVPEPAPDEIDDEIAGEAPAHEMEPAPGAVDVLDDVLNDMREAA